MLKNGNGDPLRCVENLMKTFRGEVPYERIKGLDARNIDKPSSYVDAEIEADAPWTIETYEPRVVASEVVAMAVDAINGDFHLDTSIDRREAEDGGL